MSEVKFREFSVAPYSKGLTRWSVVSAPATAVYTDFDGIHPKIINLIEYSALAAKDAEIASLKELLKSSRNVGQDLHYKCDDRANEIRMLKSELADKDAVLERVRHHVVGFKSTSEILNEIDEVLQKYRKSEG